MKNAGPVTSGTPAGDFNEMDIITEPICILEFLIHGLRALDAAEIRALRDRRWFAWHSSHSWSESSRGRFLLRHRFAPNHVGAVRQVQS